MSRPALPSDIIRQYANTASDLVITLVHQPDTNNVREPWVVWVSLERGDPRQQHEAFIIGQAMTRSAAVRKAAMQLADTLNSVVGVLSE